MFALSACQNPASGTFVGNPSMSARLVDNVVQRAQGGRFEALEIHLTGCGVDYVPLGPTVLTFDGPSSEQEIDLMLGDHCGLFFVVDQFTVEFTDDDGPTTTVIADDFDLTVPSEIAARGQERFVLRFGDIAWLADVAALAPPGEATLVTSDPDLASAFFGGLEAGSTVENTALGDFSP